MLRVDVSTEENKAGRAKYSSEVRRNHQVEDGKQLNVLKSRKLLEHKLYIEEFSGSRVKFSRNVFLFIGEGIGFSAN